jgi:hypothetical protein
MNRITVILGALLFTVQLAGCGACQRVADSRADFLREDAAKEPSRSPQIVLQIPQAMIDETLKSTQRKLSKVSFRLPGLGDLSRYIGRLSLTPTKVLLDVDRTQAVHLGVRLDVGYNRRVLFGLKLTAVAPIRYNEKTGVMEIIVNHDLFKNVEPEIPDGAVTKLAKMLRKELPQIARPLFPMSQLKKGARKGIEALSKNLYRLIRKEMLTPMGEMVRFRFQLPKIPIERVTLRSDRSGWSLGIRTSLPGGGLKSGLSAVPSSRLRVSVSTEMLASIGNWGMKTGAIPSTFNRKGTPQKKGEFVAALGWRKNARPLQLHLWTRAPETQGVCLYARAAGAPGVRLSRRQLKVSIKKGKLEELDGPPLINSAASLLGITKKTFSFTQKIALQNEVHLGTHSLGLKLQSASIDSEVLQFDFLAKAKKTKKSGS